jgi:hypothetical protein
MYGNGTVRSIGTERESSLHAALKTLYAGEYGKTEVDAGGYVCDVQTSDGELVEIQTGSFGPLKAKIARLSPYSRIRIVHPILTEKHIELIGEDGAVLRRRKSPKKGSPWDVFSALVYAPELAAAPNVSIELVLISIKEYRVQDGRGSWRRGGVSIRDKELLACRGAILLKHPQDYLRCLPFQDGEAFTVRRLAEAASISLGLARKSLYVLHCLDMVERKGKEKRAWVYERKKSRPRAALKNSD